MRIEHVDHFRCPRTGQTLKLADAKFDGAELVSGRLTAPDGASYAIENGIPNFVNSAQLTELEANTQSEYDRVADGIYDVAVDWQFDALYEDEDAVRELM